MTCEGANVGCIFYGSYTKCTGSTGNFYLDFNMTMRITQKMYMTTM